MNCTTFFTLFCGPAWRYEAARAELGAHLKSCPTCAKQILNYREDDGEDDTSSEEDSDTRLRVECAGELYYLYWSEEIKYLQVNTPCQWCANRAEVRIELAIHSIVDKNYQSVSIQSELGKTICRKAKRMWRAHQQGCS